MNHDSEQHGPSIAVAKRRSPVVPIVMIAAVAGVLWLGHGLMRRANAQTNQIALSSSPRGVTVVSARSATFRPSRRYVGTLEPWVEANVGPQLVAGFVSTVLVRPGATVHRNEILATLDCRNASATSRAIALQARALQARQEALAHQAARVSNLGDGGFVAPNEVEQREAESASEAARLAATRAQLMGSTLAVNDCVLRAPFDGEVATRSMDPGAFVRPGASIATIVDRSTVRIVADVPEADYAAVAPGTPVRLHMLANGRDITAPVSRRSPSADAATRTIHIEIDLADARRELPVGTTAELSVDVGEPVPAIEIPATAASLRGERATIFAVDHGVAHRVRAALVGERGGSVFIEPIVAPGTSVVTEGRSLLDDGDRVTTQVDASHSGDGPRVAQPPTSTAAFTGGRS